MSYTSSALVFNKKSKSGVLSRIKNCHRMLRSIKIHMQLKTQHSHVLLCKAVLKAKAIVTTSVLAEDNFTASTHKRKFRVL